MNIKLCPERFIGPSTKTATYANLNKLQPTADLKVLYSVLSVCTYIQDEKNYLDFHFEMNVAKK